MIVFPTLGDPNSLVPPLVPSDPNDLTLKFASEIALNDNDPWGWIQKRIKANNFWGINVGDYIPFVLTDGKALKAEVAGIDTYYNYGDTPVPHHIDFISRECLKEGHVWNRASFNNGTTVSPYPWLASDLYAWLNSLSSNVPDADTADPPLVAVDYTATGVFARLPVALKAVIISKRFYAPQRYTAGVLLSNDNGGGWIDLGKLWIPTEVEVFGRNTVSPSNIWNGSGSQQYPIFVGNMRRVKTSDTGVRVYWLLLNPAPTSTGIADVSGHGIVSGAGAADTSMSWPVCFRIA